MAIPVRGAKQRALLALLALNRGNPVSADRLIDQLWGDGQTAKPANALQAQIVQLRRTLGASAIVTSESGYALDIGAADLDAARFEDLVAEGRRLSTEGEVARASDVLGDALRLRRGEPLSEFAYAGFADAERAHLNELALVATEYRVEADLELGHHNELVGELEALCRDHPLRERLWELLMLALYRAGRQAEALRAYTEIRDRLVDELGIDPGSSLRELETRVLDHDPSLARRATAGAPCAGAAVGARQPARSTQQIPRTRHRTRTGGRRDRLQPLGHTDRTGWSGQDPPGARGRGTPAGSAPGRHVADRTRWRHRSRWGRPGRGRHARSRSARSG